MVTKLRTRKSTRDSEAMRERILGAVGRIIVREGLAGVGVNALAREAECDKVLIYRYFDSIEGLYAVFAAQSDFWWTAAELTTGIDPLKMPVADAIKLVLRRSAAAMRARPVTLAVLAAEPVERTPLVIALETIRERRSLELARWFAKHYALQTHIDINAITMLLGVALNYLAVRSRKIRVMSGVPIKTDKDWERIFAATDAIIDSLLRST